MNLIAGAWLIFFISFRMPTSDLIVCGLRRPTISLAVATGTVNIGWQKVKFGFTVYSEGEFFKSHSFERDDQKLFNIVAVHIEGKDIPPPPLLTGI
jgi:hypothetical protein